MDRKVEILFRGEKAEVYVDGKKRSELPEECVEITEEGGLMSLDEYVNGLVRGYGMKTSEVMKNEHRCVKRNVEGKCDRDCGRCDLRLDDDVIMHAYEETIKLLEFAEDHAEKWENGGRQKMEKAMRELEWQQKVIDALKAKHEN